MMILSVVQQIVHTQENIKIMFLAVLLIKWFVLIINLKNCKKSKVKKLFCTGEKMLFINLLNQFLMSTIIVEK